MRTAPEVMNDPHMHERGMLQHIEPLPELGPIVVPTSPLRLHGARNAPPVPSPSPWVSTMPESMAGGSGYRPT